MSRPDEGLIHQWLDGECTPEESARLEHLVATDPEWAAAVAEARGLMAASSRIVQSLDAVPRAMPAGSQAAPRATSEARGAKPLQLAKPMRRLPNWLKVAAAVVVVAGTAFALRERASEPFKPTATVDMPAPPPQPAMTAEQVSRTQPPTDLPPLGAAGTAARDVGPLERGATESAPAPVLMPQKGVAAPSAPPAPVVLAPAPAPQRAEKILESPNSISMPRAPERGITAEDARATEAARAADFDAQRRARLSVESPRGAIARAASAPAAAPAAPPSLVLLDGCWRVSAPPELVGVLAQPMVQRQSGDTLVLVTALGFRTVVRDGDTLRGALQAVRETCPSTP